MATTNLAARSPTPQQHAQPLSKRDKRRTAIHDRLNDIREAFTNNRDYHFRQHVHELQNEMALIANAEVYDEWPMSDAPEDVANQLKQLAASGHTVSEAPVTGRWYSKFVDEINRSKEERDVELTVVMHRHRDNLNRLKQDREFRHQFAIEECAKLTDTIRERLIQSISQRKNRLMREKEQLDVADTNALLLHPNQFSITNPGSPGGLQSNRKTRHTRHRVDVDEMGNAIIAETAIKRKRKAPADDDFGSPNVEGLSTPADRAKARLNQQQNAPLYNILSLFTEKELAMHSNQAHVAALHFLSASKRAKQAAGSAGQGIEGEEGAGSGDTSSQEDGMAAPEMERTASQSVHATRSTRNNATAGLNLLGELTDKNANRPNLPYFILGNYHQRPNGSGTAPPPPPLMPEEIEDDIARIEKLKKTKPRGWIDNRLVNHLLDALVPPESEATTVSCERFSSLHPDFPREMDVHLVRAYPRQDS
ncbi:deacetylase complex subunit Sds3 [Coccidioides immitis RS]|uniref:Deacetylase complex subunit Sds3 n=3 Tax=Coccidioides immitis TaxID=5501 RepID=J3KBG0_COCIM|nr:deacetylase complex subunit Sds3 [Coccidioides immitis RS]EAS32450.3 deacetylase complex subunit Sds3 [Coccidioides immitis RS]KMP07688.1 hypothetical protein CIRG_07369 [Coccidioides immitis RMSCC 2394]KMU82774.1 hypothetical protein CIHG_00556 [Coccidioides immitis H538.4]TPX19577.1 hypothetical protein DIZ76_017369 [Coccidioides immitis]